MDDETIRSFRIGNVLRLGLQICESYNCRCGIHVDIYGIHALYFPHKTGRLLRKAAMNDTLNRALNSARFNSVLELVYLDREDGKQSDEIKK